MDYVSLKLDELISNYERNITLQCKDCEYIECPIVPNGTYWRGKQGCTRKVLEGVADAYVHYMEEVVPFLRTYSSAARDKLYNEVIDFLYSEIYSSPLGQKLGPDGKVKISR